MQIPAEIGEVEFTDAHEKEGVIWHTARALSGRNKGDSKN